MSTSTLELGLLCMYYLLNLSSVVRGSTRFD
jgi:hypothetical protein